MMRNSNGDTPDATVEKTSSNNTLVKKGNKTLFEGPDSAAAIQIGINNLSQGQDIYLYNGTYAISRQLNFSDHVYVHGQGNNTILDYSDIGSYDALEMGIGSHLANIKVSGSIVPFPSDYTQKVRANDSTIIENVSISNMGYGIDVFGRKNITLTNIRCEFIQSERDWGACIHGGGGTKDLIVRQFTITHSNRGIELDANTTNVHAKNGYMFMIRNFNNTGHEAFSLDVHSHEGEGKSANIYFDSIYLKDSYAPSAKVSVEENPKTNNSDYSLSELPTNIFYKNITLINPTSPWQIAGDGVTVKNSKIINATGGGIEFYGNSRNMWVENVTSIDNSDLPNYLPIQNMTLVNNTIVNVYNESDSTATLNEITGLQYNMLNAATDSSPISNRAINSLYACNNHINYSNRTLCTYYNVEQYKGFGFLDVGTNLIKSSLMDLEYLETLGYGNNSFILKGEKTNNTKLLQIGTGNGTSTATLYPGRHNQEVTLWSSKPIQHSKERPINYIEAKFRVLDTQNETKENHAGIIWNDGQKDWYTLLRSHSLSMYNSVDKEFAKNPDTSRHNGTWYTLKILLLQNGTDVYLDDILKFHIPRALSDNIGLSNIGIRSVNINAEFKPIKIGIIETNELRQTEQ